MNSRIRKLLDNGWEVFDTCYEYADDVISRAKSEGFKHIKAYRVKTDTPHLPMFTVLVKK